jgi:hypothetical protein
MRRTQGRRGGSKGFIRIGMVLGVLVVTVAAMLALTTTAPAGTCSACGKNLIKNPGAEAGAGVTAVGAYGNVPGWTSEAGQFGAASYTSRTGGSRRQPRARRRAAGTTSSGARRLKPLQRRRRSGSR